MCLTPFVYPLTPLCRYSFRTPAHAETPRIAAFERDQHVHFQGEGIEIWGKGICQGLSAPSWGLAPACGGREGP